jgi:hypothetical protein
MRAPVLTTKIGTPNGGCRIRWRPPGSKPAGQGRHQLGMSPLARGLRFHLMWYGVYYAVFIVITTYNYTITFYNCALYIGDAPPECIHGTHITT